MLLDDLVSFVELEEDLVKLVSGRLDKLNFKDGKEIMLLDDIDSLKEDMVLLDEIYIVRIELDVDLLEEVNSEDGTEIMLLDDMDSFAEVEDLV